MSPIIRMAREQIRPSDIDRLVRILQEDGVAVVPADTVYGLIGKAFNKTVFDRLDAIKEDRRLPYVVIFSSLESVEEWTGGLNYRQRRFASALLPGPLTMIMTPKGKIPADFRYKTSGIGIRVSSDTLLPLLAERLGAPIWASSANRSDDPAPSDYRTVNRNVIQAVDMAVDAGPTIFHDASTVVDIRSKVFKITREGPWLSRINKAIKRSNDPLEVLVLCSGNICRSPIAAYLLENANIPHITVKSAGLDASNHQRATSEMVEIGSSWGIDMSGHLSQTASLEVLHEADIILTATPEHRERVIQIDSRAKRKTFLIADGIGETTIPDPYKSGGEMYRTVAEMIRRSIEGWSLRLGRVVQSEFESEEVPKETFHDDSPNGD